MLVELDVRRRALGMSMETLAERSGLSVRSLFRMLSGGQPHARWSNVVAVAEALGVSVQLAPVADSEELRERQAKLKAKQLVRMVQGTSALEAQGVESSQLAEMERRTVHELLAGSDRKLWAK